VGRRRVRWWPGCSECADRLATSRARGAGRARAWLRGREFDDGFLADNLVGWDPGAHHDRSRPERLRERHGIPRMSGVTFPLFDVAGCLPYVQTRSPTWTPTSDHPRYVSPTRIHNPRSGIWADPGPRAGAPVLVTEGPTDSLTARQAGYDVAGLIGATHANDPATATTLLATLGTDRSYVILTDPDPAGPGTAWSSTSGPAAPSLSTAHHPPTATSPTGPPPSDRPFPPTSAPTSAGPRPKRPALSARPSPATRLS
jgi:hypothetical protein